MRNSLPSEVLINHVHLRRQNDDALSGEKCKEIAENRIVSIRRRIMEETVVLFRWGRYPNLIFVDRMGGMPHLEHVHRSRRLS
jgi:hypothetical protein